MTTCYNIDGDETRRQHNGDRTRGIQLMFEQEM